VLTPKLEEKGFAPKFDDVPNPEVAEVEEAVNPSSVLGVAAVLLIDPGLVDVAPPKIEVPLAPVEFVVVFVLFVEKLKGGGFFFAAPENPRTAG
jgi:hypothetical protein